jgi:hypothetical protein
MQTIDYEGETLDIRSIINNSRFDILDNIYQNKLLIFSLPDWDIKTNRTDKIRDLILTSIGSRAKNILNVLKWLHSNEILEFDYNTYGAISLCSNYEMIFDWIFEEHICDVTINLDIFGLMIDTKRIKYFIQLKRESKPIYLQYSYSYIDCVSTSNNIKLLDCLFDNRDIINFDYSAVAINCANIKVLDWWYSKYKLGLVEFKYTNLYIANAMSDVTRLKWWLDHAEEFKTDPVCYDLRLCNIESLKFLIEDQNYLIIKVTPYVLSTIINSCYRLKILEYLFENRDKVGFELDYMIIDNINNVDTLDWFYNKYQLGLLPFSYTEKAIANAFNKNILGILKWWINHANVLEIKYDLNMFTYYTNLNIIKYILSEQNIIEIPIHKFIDNCQNHYILNYIYEEKHIFGFDYTTNSIDYTTHPDILNWWFQHANVLKLKYTKLAIDYACKRDQLEIIKIWYDRRFDFKLKFTEEILLTYINDKLEERQFLLELINN